MKKDIQNKDDIQLMVDRFYEAIQQDALLGPIFNDVNKVDWPSHLLKMYQFWENAIFYTGGYHGNPLHVHQRIHALFPLTSDHFYRWNEIFINIVNEHFEGKNAALAKTRALHISMVLQEKLARVDQLQHLFANK